MTQSLQGRLEALYGLERRKDKLGLEGTRALLAALGDPHRRFRSVHVAGTNGKGSVCAIVERVLREAGHRTGLFTSPHLVDFRERIRVDGRWADAGWLEQALDRIEALPGARDRTFFEVSTALGFLYFAERGVAWAVVEVGLGGRLDTTNVLEPDVTVITSLSLDHTDILGRTIEAIATEKGGIIKPGVPVVVGGVGPNGSRVIEAIAARVSAPVRWTDDGQLKSHQTGTVVRLGSFWLHTNVVTASAVLDVLNEGVLPIPVEARVSGLRHARWPGRFERSEREPRLWWDGAHNVAAFYTLVDLWDAVFEEPPASIVLALARDKDVAPIFDLLGDRFPLVRYIVTRTRSERARPPADLAEAASARGLSFEAVPDVPSALEKALASKAGRVLLAGSLFAVGEAMEIYGGAPGEQL